MTLCNDGRGYDFMQYYTYIRGYERVKLLLMQGTPVDRIAPLLGMQPSVVQEYAALVFQYHPHLLPDEVSPNQT